jgi:hypothetical protein
MDELDGDVLVLLPSTYAWKKLMIKCGKCEFFSALMPQKGDSEGN